jgi:hypothetical protein
METLVFATHRITLPERKAAGHVASLLENGYEVVTCVTDGVVHHNIFGTKDGTDFELYR